MPKLNSKEMEQKVAECGRFFSFSPTLGPFIFIVVALIELAKWAGWVK
jgi:hypothetical protein